MIDIAWDNADGSGCATTWDTPPASPEVRATVAAAALVAWDNQTAPQVTSTMEEVEWGAPSVIQNMEYDSDFYTEVCDVQNTRTHICDVCFNDDVITGFAQLKEANFTYITKAQAIQNLHYCVGNIVHEKLQHLVENGQWSWAHAPKPLNFVGSYLHVLTVH